MRSRTLLLSLLLVPQLAFATSISYTGSLDPANPNDVFLTSFSLATPSAVVIQSYGYGGSSDAPGGTNAAGTVIPAGGFDTYLSLFQGLGSGATFLASNDDGGCGPAAPDPVCEDSRLSFPTLAAGDYTIALTLPGNFSFAENYGSGTLGDGFIGLQGDYFDAASATVRSSAYAFDLTYTPAVTTTPESSSLVLFGTGLMAGVVAVRRRIATGRF